MSKITDAVKDELLKGFERLREAKNNGGGVELMQAIAYNKSVTDLSNQLLSIERLEQAERDNMPNFIEHNDKKIKHINHQSTSTCYDVSKLPRIVK